MTGYEAGVQAATLSTNLGHGADAQLSRHGHMVVLHPLSDDARDWAGDALPAATEHWTGGYTLAPDTMGAVLADFVANGLTINQGW